VSAAQEKDEIYSLLCYSLVYKYWQEDDRKGRGYNVGCLLTNTEGQIVAWELNHVNATGNCTQHGEVRLMTSYLNKEGLYSLSGHDMFVSLEPCAMCAGMMIMANVNRCISGQHDYYYSEALERLAFDSRSINGFAPYPRSVKHIYTTLPYAKRLENGYMKYIQEGNPAIITRFLATPRAKEVFAEASAKFQSYFVQFTQNQGLYKQAIKFYNQLPEK
jgi:tRNA(Arg) A34 adenosine deaminase TadA